MEVAMILILILVTVGIVGFTIKLLAQFFWLLISSPVVWLILIIIFLTLSHFV